ncbi:MAG: hypothetical protein J5949_09920 [Oscillospiraceae bacterium]|nr:hypothetical protein [Oscillospiraceae bacterium]
MALHFDTPARLAHAWILTSPSQEDTQRASREIAAAAVCQRGVDVPCGQCRSCRKAFAGTHPDISVIRRLPDRNGNLRRDIIIDQVREMILDAPVLPIEADRKVYIIEEAERMNPNAQNAALKLLEEPPACAVFVLCTSNPDLLLETVRSRCSLLSLGGEEDAPDANAAKAADEYLQIVGSGSHEKLFQWIARNEGSMDEARTFVDAALYRVADVTAGRIFPGLLTPQQGMHIYRLLSQCAVYLRANVNARHIYSLLAAESFYESGKHHD